MEIMTGEASSRDAVLAAIPELRAFAISLCRNCDHAEDLVQEALLRARGVGARLTPKYQ